jgi:alanine dehydrogenase
MGLPRLGLIGRSLKQDERRVAIHPQHLARIPDNLRRQLVFEADYGEPFGVTDVQVAEHAVATASRDDLFEMCDIIALPKPMHEDLRRMRPHQVLWGWCHCVQDSTFTQLAIERQLTLIAWESMNTWHADGRWQSHVFRSNNEIAGYAAVLHATGLLGIAGHYGPPHRAVVLHFGSVSQGAARALHDLGFGPVTVLVQQQPETIARPAGGVAYRQILRGRSDRLMIAAPDGRTGPLIDELAAADIIVNGMLQDADAPLMFVYADQVDRLKPGFLIIDVSCDAGMGFSFARPTSFEQPMFAVGRGHYYAVDHTPSYLWQSATWEISAALLPFLPIVLAGPAQWHTDETIRRAIEIRDGVVVNGKILSFQNRAREYPHAKRPSQAE